MRHDIVPAIEAILWDYEPEFQPEELDFFSDDELTMWASASTSPNANRVVRVSFPEGEAEERIEKIIEFFRAHDRDFTWSVGPSTRPADLAERLVRRGFVARDRFDGLALALPVELRPPPPPGLEIEEVSTEATAREYARVTSGTSGNYAGVDEHRVREIAGYIGLPARRGGYLLARLNGEAVGNAAWRDSSDGFAAYLTGGATLPAYRNRGVYSALLAYRLHEAARRGRKLAAVHANVRTSSPILRKPGFRRHCGITVYGYRHQISSETIQ